MPSTAHFVLVHGLSLGAWCWYKVRCLMESSGYRVSCLDLKSAGSDLTDPYTVLTLEDYHQSLYDFFSALPENEKVIIVGHSAGGTSTVTDAMYKFPEKTKGVVYIVAPMLKHGFSTTQDIKDGIPDLSKYGDVCNYGYGYRFGPDEPPIPRALLCLRKSFREKFYYEPTQSNHT